MKIVFRSLLPIVFVLALVTGQTAKEQLASLAATERAFARATAELGVRNGFLTFFADDAVAFQPTLGKAKENLMKRPQPPLPLPNLLLWNPETGDAARSGDIGYLTGPSAVLDRSHNDSVVYSGQYFSVWKRQRDGTWKVFIDVGIETPWRNMDILRQVFTPAPSYEERPDTNSRGTLKALKEAEFKLNNSFRDEKQNPSSFYHTAARLHRNKQAPFTESESVRAVLAHERGLNARFLKGGVSEAGDLAYAYGSRKLNKQNAYYVRVWKWNRNGGWKVVVDVGTEQ